MFFYFFSKIYIIYTKPYKKRYLSVHRKSEKKIEKKAKFIQFFEFPQKSSLHNLRELIEKVSNPFNLSAFLDQYQHFNLKKLKS